jgi:DeoR family transcriptional regulator of aga operon
MKRPQPKSSKRSSATRAEVIPEQRRKLVLEYLLQHGSASIQALSDAIAISASTVRRDLERLEDEGHLRRTHGGAVVSSANHSTFEPRASVAAKVAQAEKRAIGHAAAALLSTGDSVIFDSGSTVFAAARAVVERRIALTAVTNDLGIAQCLAAPDNIHVVVLGGSVRPASLTMMGEPGASFVADLHADIAFIGAQSVADGMLSDASVEVATIKRAMIAAARRVVLLVDSSKFQPAAFYRICALTDVHEVITDSSVSRDELAKLHDLGLRVTTVKVPRASAR